MKREDLPYGIDVVWSRVNQAFLVLFVGPKGNKVLRVLQTKEEVEDFLKDLRPRLNPCDNPRVGRAKTKARGPRGRRDHYGIHSLGEEFEDDDDLYAQFEGYEEGSTEVGLPLAGPSAGYRQPLIPFKRGHFEEVRFFKGKKGNPEMNEEVLESMARTLFVEAWAHYTEEEHPEKTRHWGGKNLMDLAPETPAEVMDIARALYLKIEKKNGPGSIEKVVSVGTLLEDEGGAEAQGADPDLLGHYLVMEALGHGVAWTDDHDEHGLDIPDIETWWDGEELGQSGL